jgi:hypothetical protein
MHIKFLAHGTGDPHRAIEYLLASHDYKGQRRPEVRVLRGDPYQVADVANTLPFVHRYTSCTIAWAQEDDPSPTEVDAVLDGFERIAFAGLSADRYALTVISHGCHVHILNSRVDLLTGKSFNVAPPPWKGAFYPLRDYWNGAKGWARPQDMRRARFLAMMAPRPKPDVAKKVEEHVALGFALSDIETALNVEPDTEFLIADWLLDLIHEGEILTHMDVLAALNSEGTVLDTKKNSLKFLAHDSQWPVQLTGRLFAQDFHAREVLDRADIQEKLCAGRAEPDPEFTEAAHQKMQAVIAYRTAYNQEYFKPLVKVKQDKQSKTVAALVHKQVKRGALAKVPNEFNSIMGPARRALALARQAIERCTEMCKSTLHRVSELAVAGSSNDQLAMERAIEAQRALKKLELKSTGLGDVQQKL